MKKFTITMLAASCAMALSACSSHSGGSDNSAQLRETENALRQQLVDVETKANNATESASKANSNAAKTEAELKTANENATKLAAQVAQATEKEKETAKKLADLELAQAKLEQRTIEQEKAQQDAQQKSKSESDKQISDLIQKNQEQQNAQQQSKAESDKRIAELEEKAKQAAQDLDEAKANSQKANAELEKLKEAEKQAQAEKQAAAKRLQDLENLQASEKARIPVSDLIFGGTSGTVPKTFTGLSGGVWQTNGTGLELNAPNAREGMSSLAIVDKTGKVREVGLSNEVYYGYVSQDYYSGNIASSPEKFPDVRFGVYIDALDGTKAIYSQGKATAVEQIPTSGSATYKGAITYSVDDKSYSEDYARLTANVNFDNKTVDFTVPKMASVPEMAFSAKITANSFAGDVNNIKTQGAFYGENASQLSGLYINEQEKEQGKISRGAYGAVKATE